jgi:inosine-uridine nucleoside N-ribohydrolase
LRPQRHELFEFERSLTGMGHDTWGGAFGRAKPKSWQDVYKKYNRSTEIKISNKHAVNFIIDTVRAHPGEITIAAIGPAGNLALAVRMAPDIIPLVKRVVYMGGAFYQPGNVTPAAEFNWWFDPEAARIAVRTPFKEQIVLGLDVCEKVVFRREHYDRLVKTLDKSEQANILRSGLDGVRFEKDPAFTHFVWDVLVAAVIIDPTLITKEVTRFIDVNTDYGISYGQSLAYPKLAPKGAQQARIVLDVDQKRFWDMLNDTTYWASARQGQSE